MNKNKIIILQNDLTDERLALHMSSSSHILDPEQQGYLSVDCEMMGLKPLRDRLCLVQLCDENKNVTLVQVGMDQDSAPNLQKLLEHEKITKLFHFARADLAHLSCQLNIQVNPIFCTKVASKLARTYTERHGLREVAREFLGIDLNKNQQSSDWGQPHLTQEQIDYAAGDVLHLIEIKDALTKMLRREGRLELAEQCFTQIPLLSDLDNFGYEFVFEHNNPLSTRK